MLPARFSAVKLLPSPGRALVTISTLRAPWTSVASCNDRRMRPITMRYSSEMRVRVVRATTIPARSKASSCTAGRPGCPTRWGLPPPPARAVGKAPLAPRPICTIGGGAATSGAARSPGTASAGRRPGCASSKSAGPGTGCPAARPSALRASARARGTPAGGSASTTPTRLSGGAANGRKPGTVGAVDGKAGGPSDGSTTGRTGAAPGKLPPLASRSRAAARSIRWSPRSLMLPSPAPHHRRPRVETVRAAAPTGILLRVCSPALPAHRC